MQNLYPFPAESLSRKSLQLICSQPLLYKVRVSRPANVRPLLLRPHLLAIHLRPSLPASPINAISPTTYSWHSSAGLCAFANGYIHLSRWLARSLFVWQSMAAMHDFLHGCSSVSWYYQHVLGHHVYTNVDGADPVISGEFGLYVLFLRLPYDRSRSLRRSIPVQQLDGLGSSLISMLSSQHFLYSLRH